MTDKLNIVLTGVTRGLGKAMLEGFSERGHRVFGCGRSAEKINDLKKRYPENDFQMVDIANAKAVSRWAEDVLQKITAPDFLINNAAIINELAPLWKIPEKQFSDLIDINIKGVANAIRNFVPPMVKRKKGIIVNFSSGWGKSTSPEVAPYCTSKWAIEGMSQALAQELPKGMAAIALSPGVINTDMLKVCFREEASMYQGPDSWKKKAVPFILDLSGKDNGKSLRID